MAEMDELQEALRAQRRHVREALSGLTAGDLLTPLAPTSYGPADRDRGLGPHGVTFRT